MVWAKLRKYLNPCVKSVVTIVLYNDGIILCSNNVVSVSKNAYASIHINATIFHNEIFLKWYKTYFYEFIDLTKYF